jgi:SulP family sulfate permease
MLLPKLVTSLREYSPSQFRADLIAGVIVGIVAIPLAIAFAIASGLSPDKGLLTAIVAGFVISLLGGSRVQIGGPTGAFVVIVYGIVQKYGVDGLLIATILGGMILVAMGLLRLGTVIKFIPHPVVVGFTSGIAVVIFSSQIKDFLGLRIGALPADFLPKWSTALQNLNTFNPYAIALAAGSVLLIALWPRVSRLSRKLPGPFVALITASIFSAAFQWPVETIGSRFGALSMTPRLPSFPALNLQTVQNLLAPALIIAMLGAVESLLSAVVSDGMIGGRHRSNMELIAQGIANIASGLVGGMPATGAIARTVTNIKSGGRTPVAGIVHALTILLTVVFLGSLVKWIPLACLAGILVVVAYHMSEWRSFRALLHGPRGSVGVLLVTFLLTVLVDLTVAIEVGMVLSAFLFMHRMARTSHIRVVSHHLDIGDPHDETALYKVAVPKGIEVFEINGPFFFGISHEFEEVSRIVAERPKVRVLRLRHVPFIDATGLHSLRQFHAKCRGHRIHLVLANVHSQPLQILKQSGLFDQLGADNILITIQQALARATALIDTPWHD